MSRSEAERRATNSVQEVCLEQSRFLTLQDFKLMIRRLA
jgi:hypothetical protein